MKRGEENRSEEALGIRVGGRKEQENGAQGERRFGQLYI